MNKYKFKKFKQNHTRKSDGFRVSSIFASFWNLACATPNAEIGVKCLMEEERERAAKEEIDFLSIFLFLGIILKRGFLKILEIELKFINRVEGGVN